MSFYQIRLVFRKNLNYQTMETDLPPALENKTSSELVQEYLNSLHSVLENFKKTGFKRAEKGH